MDAGFVLALPFHHGDLQPDSVGVLTRGGEVLMRGIKITLQDFALKMQGGGSIFAGHYGTRLQQVVFLEIIVRRRLSALHMDIFFC